MEYQFWETSSCVSHKIGNEIYSHGYPAGHHMLVEDWIYVFAVTSQDLGALPVENPIRVGGRESH
jgi:hypothetical protein